MPNPMLPAWTDGVLREVLPNGLTLLLQRDRSAPVASVVTHLKAGFFDEPDRWIGISHVLEHMFFKGTPTRGVGQIAKETKAAGGYLNAHTSYDHTSYFAVLPADRLPEALAIQADALMHASLDGDELRRELQVIIQEAKRKLDSPGSVTHETLHEVLYDRHRIRRWRIGYEKALAAFTRADVAGYYGSRYVPERTIVAIVGDVDAEATLALARATYQAWPGAPGAIDPSPVEPPRRRVAARTLRGDVTQAELALGWRGVPPLDARALPLDLAAGVLGSGRGSWLYRALRETGLVTGVSAHHYAPTEIGVFSIGAQFDPARVPEVLERVAECTTRLALQGADEDDLERARTLLLTRWSRRMEEMDGRAAALASAEALESYRLVDREFALLAATTGEQMRRAAESVLDPEAVSGVLYLPRERGMELTEEGLARAFAVTGIGATSPGRLGASAVHVRPPTAVKASALVAEVSHVALPAFDLLVRRKPGVPTVTLGVYLPRVEFDPPGQAGLSALAVRCLPRGAGEYDAAGLAFASERLGGSLGTSITLDWLGVGTTVLAARLGEAAGLLDLVLHQPNYLPAQVESERGLLVEETTQVADDMFRFPFQLAFGAAYGDRGYGLPALGLPGDLAGLSVEQVRSWHQRALGTPRGVVVAVGDLDVDSALGTLAGVFGGHGARPAAGLGTPAGWMGGIEPVTRVVSRQKAQSAVAMVFPGPSRRDRDRHAAEVWCAVASGLGGRLFEALRERRSLAYTVVATSWQKARGGNFVSYIATAPEREEEARREMLAELGRFAEERVTPTELAQATSYLAGQTAVGRQGSAAVAGEVLEAWLAGEGLSDLTDPAASYRAVSAEQIREAAARSLSGARAEGVVRGST